jgi:hypothetical protein
VASGQDSRGLLPLEAVQRVALDGEVAAASAEAPHRGSSLGVDLGDLVATLTYPAHLKLN